jgi:hypothetical protein
MRVDDLLGVGQRVLETIADDLEVLGHLPKTGANRLAVNSMTKFSIFQLLFKKLC